jgi:OmpA-OmpF porin, OOP family
MINKLALGLLVSTSSSYLAAQTITDIQAPPNSAYSQDSGGAVTRSAYGLCWRSGNWTPGDAIPGCDGPLAPPITNPTAPELVSNLETPGQSIPISTTNPCNFTITLESDQIFTFNKALLTSHAKKRIDHDVLPKLAECKVIDGITITGHTDSIGSRQSNQKLSEKQAASLVSYLKSKGVAAKMNAAGVGGTQPIKACDKKMEHAKLIACLAPNRRVLIEAHAL